MAKIKLKFNYGSETRVFDITVSITDKEGRGFVLIPGHMETERSIFLSSGNYYLEAIYDLPEEEGVGKKTLVFDKRFSSDTTSRVSIDFTKPKSVIEPFSTEQLQHLEKIFSSTIGGRANLKAVQSFTSNLVKQMPNATLDERVVVDKNGKVEYEFSYNEQEFYDIEEGERSVQEVPILKKIEEGGAAPRPYNSYTPNHGFWNIDLYNLNLLVGSEKNGYRNVRSTAYLRPRSELFKRLAVFIEENIEISRRINRL